MRLLTSGRPLSAVVMILPAALAMMMSADSVLCSQGSVQAIETDVCSIVAHLKQFNKKRVRVHARIIRSMHVTVLVDDSCRGRGIALLVAESVRDHPDFKAMYDAIDRQGFIGTGDKTAYATFTGEFLYRRRKHPPRVLNADKVEDLDVKMIRPDEKH